MYSFRLLWNLFWYLIVPTRDFQRERERECVVPSQVLFIFFIYFSSYCVPLKTNKRDCVSAANIKQSGEHTTERVRKKWEWKKCDFLNIWHPLYITLHVYTTMLAVWNIIETTSRYHVNDGHCSTAYYSIRVLFHAYLYCKESVYVCVCDWLKAQAKLKTLFWPILSQRKAEKHEDDYEISNWNWVDKEQIERERERAREWNEAFNYAKLFWFLIWWSGLPVTNMHEKGNICTAFSIVAATAAALFFWICNQNTKFNYRAKTPRKNMCKTKSNKWVCGGIAIRRIYWISKSTEWKGILENMSVYL